MFFFFFFSGISPFVFVFGKRNGTRNKLVVTTLTPAGKASLFNGREKGKRKREKERKIWLQNGECV